MSNYYFGVVEDVEDPLKVGRVRVRVLGLHTADKSKIATGDLPWAIPIQPTQSAAMSGIGISPTGILPGSWVVVVFTDSDQQTPIILGSIIGVPNIQDTISEAIKAETFDKPDTEKLPSEKTLEETTSSKPGDPYIGSLTENDYNNFKAAIKQKESSGKQNAVNQFGYLGWYQFGVAALEDLGYVVKGTWSKYKKNSVLSDNSVWTGKEGVDSKDAYLSNGRVQDKVMLMNVQNNYKILKNKGAVSQTTPPEKLAGLLGVAHNQGAGAAIKYLKGDVGIDGNGVSGTEYYNLGFKSVKGNITNEFATAKNIERPPIDTDVAKKNDNSKYDVQDSAVVKSLPPNLSGFMDPMGVYPTRDYMNEPDTNRLARNQKVSTTIVGEKETTHDKNIAIALGAATWNQPTVPYNAKYPHNKVFATESGHVLEFDDTPECERINIHHSSGAFIEIDTNGTITTKTKGHHAVIIDRDGLVHVKGSQHIHVDGDATMYVGGGVHIETPKSANIKAMHVNIDAEQTANIVAGQSISLKANVISLASEAAVNIVGGAINSDGLLLDNVGAATAACAPIIDGDLTGSMKYRGTSTQLPIKSRHEEADFLLEGTDEAAARAALSAESDPPQEIKQEALVVGTKQKSVSVPCSFLQPITLERTIISSNFALKDFCLDGGFAFNGQHGLSANEILCNLKHLSVNIMEPLKARYITKGIKWNSVFRPAGGNISTSKKISQHELGEAVDIGFSKIRGLPNDRELYFELAKEIQNSVPFDQMLLEYTSAGSVWIHVSFTTKRSLRYQVLTLNNHKTVGQGLILLGPKA